MSDDRYEVMGFAPTWVQYALKKRIWLEDDCTRRTPGHEGIADAWERLFGQKLDVKKAIAQHDDGDRVYYLFRDGEVACSACDADSIFEAPPALARALWSTKEERAT